MQIKEIPASIIIFEYKILNGDVSANDIITLNDTSFVINNINTEDTVKKIVITDTFSNISTIKVGNEYTTKNNDKILVTAIDFISKVPTKISFM